MISSGLAGRDEMLPSVFRVTQLARDVITRSHSQLVHLMRDAGYEVDRAGIDDALEAVASFRSERYLRRDHQAGGDLWAPLSGDYRAGDGRWIRLHCNFKHHEAAVLRVLGSAGERDAVARRVEQWNALALEAAVIDAGGAAAAERTNDEWIVTARPEHPLIEIEKTGEAAPRVLEIDSVAPLRHLRVLDLTRVIAGPVGGRVLAAYGADVLRIGAKRVPVMGEVEVMDTGFGKRFAELDITVQDEREKLIELARDAHVMLRSYRYGTLERYGLGAEELAEIAPGSIYVSLTAYGKGPWYARRGFDSLVQMASGITRTAASMAGRDAPLPLPAQALDHATGWLIATGALEALRRQRSEGGSWHVRLSLAATAEYLKSFGTFDGLAIREPSYEDVAPSLREMDSAFGTLTFAKVPGYVGDVNIQWTAPPHRQGEDAPEWR